MFVGIVPSNVNANFRLDYLKKNSGIVLDLGVYLVGSSANGFATEDTDADICIVISSYPVIDDNEESVPQADIVFLFLDRSEAWSGEVSGDCPTSLAKENL